MSAKRPIKLVGGPGTVKVYPEAASQTFKAGERVYLDGSGYVAELTNAGDTGSVKFVGIAAADASNDAVAGTSKVPVYVGPENIFEANGTGPGTDAVTALTHVGSKFPMYSDAANGIATVDLDDTGSKIDCCRVLNVDKVDAVGATNGRVWFHLTRDALEVHGD